MGLQMGNQQTTSLLRSFIFPFIFISMLIIGTAVVYSMTRLQSVVPDVYTQQVAVSNAGLDARTSILRLQNRILEITLIKDPSKIVGQQTEMLAQENNLRKAFSVLKAQSPDNPETISETERLLDNWQKTRMQIAGLIRNGYRDKELQLAVEANAQIYSRLENNLDTIAVATRHRMGNSLEAEKKQFSDMTHLIWICLGSLAALSILAGVLVNRKIATMLKQEGQSVKNQYENSERLRLALANAEEGTWDLDVPTGRLNFDTQWGVLLNYECQTQCPNSFEDWAALIHSEDRERVLKTMRDHVEGRLSEYKAEYRIRSGTGDTRWVVGHGRAVQRDQMGRALRVIGVTRDITQMKNAENRIWQLAHSDFLTGLPNRPLFYGHLKKSIVMATRHNQKLAILFLDLDGFKQINDRFGHDTGDGLLTEVARCLSLNIRGEDIVARTGGDEFIFILHNISHATNAARIATKIIDVLAEPFIINGNTCRIGGSIGISIFPDDSDDMETLVSQSDDAMYRAKRMGKNNYQFFSTALS